VPSRECRDRVLDDLDVIEVNTREGCEIVGRKHAVGRGAGGDETRTGSPKLAEHRVRVLVRQDRDDQRVVVRWKPFDEVARTVGIVRTVSDLAFPPLEPSRERDVRIGRDRVTDERLRGLARLAESDVETGTRCLTCRPGGRRSPRPDRELFAAIASTVSPRTSVCSSPTFVSRTTRVRSTFVASYRPPSPASTTATSTPASAKEARAAAVTISNWVACRRSAVGRTSATASSKSASAPFSRIRSPQPAMCGEMVEPTESPSERSSCSM
jgi:hypothetical protein